MRPDFVKPMTAGGGAFLVIAGIALIGFALLPAPLKFQFLGGGFALGAVAIVVASVVYRGVAGKPSRQQVLILWLTIAVEVLLIAVLVPQLSDERSMWLALLGIVGLHLLPMYWTHGVLIAVLGLANLIVVATAWRLRDIPLQWVIEIDGLLKLAFGVWMFFLAHQLKNQRPKAKVQ